MPIKTLIGTDNLRPWGATIDFKTGTLFVSNACVNIISSLPVKTVRSGTVPASSVAILRCYIPEAKNLVGKTLLIEGREGKNVMVPRALVKLSKTGVVAITNPTHTNLYLSRNRVVARVVFTVKDKEEIDILRVETEKPVQETDAMDSWTTPGGDELNKSKIMLQNWM